MVEELNAYSGYFNCKHEVRPKGSRFQGASSGHFYVFPKKKGTLPPPHKTKTITKIDEVQATHTGISLIPI